MYTIQIPPKTRERMTELVDVIQAAQGQLQAIEATLRETLNVPDTYTLRNVHEGFVPPARSDAGGAAEAAEGERT